MVQSRDQIASRITEITLVRGEGEDPLTCKQTDRWEASSIVVDEDNMFVEEVDEIIDGPEGVIKDWLAYSSDVAEITVDGVTPSECFDWIRPMLPSGIEGVRINQEWHDA